MKIVHRLAFHATAADRREMDRLGLLPHKGGKVPPDWVSFDVSESDRSWPDVSDWIRRRELWTLVRTVFTRAEIERANWLEVSPDWHHGYPEPDPGSFGYREHTYDVSDSCRVCRAGARQNRPFRMKSEPRWGARSILQMNWVFYEYFVKPEVWEEVFRPLGVGCLPVLDRNGATLQTVVQLEITEQVALDLEGLEAETCPECGRRRYLPLVRGETAPLAGLPAGNLIRTTQWFGSGASAWNVIVASRTLRQAIEEAHATGVSFRPLRSASMT
jgi:hypothetical protein